jgi:hypothetical protein
MKALSERQAGACENAKTPANRCACRCGGLLHGMSRGGEASASRSFLECLPADDPHKIPSAQDKRDRRNRRRRERARERRTGMRDMFAEVAR